MYTASSLQEASKMLHIKHLSRHFFYNLEHYFLSNRKTNKNILDCNQSNVYSAHTKRQYYYYCYNCN